ncbi:hypothetical protein J437_LFUL012900 [Ladona fulva]|uniref:Uncharacterized protein n=1 Tax=Ladona fulva TaxID=123851 RepID=A0A8K0P1Q9_LADFU|nr:hypothetical protein J437_LFUL012900 [Ladona fulva]
MPQNNSRKCIYADDLALSTQKQDLNSESAILTSDLSKLNIAVKHEMMKVKDEDWLPIHQDVSSGHLRLKSLMWADVHLNGSINITSEWKK